MKTLKIGHERYVADKEIGREGGRLVLAHGEMTGHAHAIDSKAARMFEVKNDEAAMTALGTRILAARAPVTLRHEEHSAITIPNGTWGVRIQRQYEAGAFRRVED